MIDDVASFGDDASGWLSELRLTETLGSMPDAQIIVIGLVGIALAAYPVTWQVLGYPVTIVHELIGAGSLNDKLARQVVEGVLAGEGSPDEVVAARGLAVVSDDGALGTAVDDAIAAMPDVAEKIRGGNLGAVGALIGAVMKATRGQADAGRARELILERLS